MKALSDACRITQGGTPDTAIGSFWGGSVQWITPAEMGKGRSKYISKTVRSITDEGLANCSSELLPANSVILSTRAPIGHLAINQVPMAINQGCRGLIPKPGFVTHFVYYALDKSKAQLNDLGSGNTFKELSGNTLKNFVVAIPQPDEQQKIADCLTSVDDFITAQSQKLDALKVHKKGLMQQLFPAMDDDCMDAGGRATQGAVADDCMDAGGRATQGAVADDCMDAGGTSPRMDEGRATQDAKAEVGA